MDSVVVVRLLVGWRFCTAAREGFLLLLLRLFLFPSVLQLPGRGEWRCLLCCVRCMEAVVFLFPLPFSDRGLLR